jgi:hypothetical protein
MNQDTNNEVARLRWEIKISEEDGITPYLWDNRKYDNYDLGSLCRTLNEYEEKTNEVARLRELLKRSVEIAETACKYLDTGGWNEDEEYSGKDGWVTETEINEVCATLAALKSEIK